jgi:HEAT repeat protein/lysophospholipase L1-like esterase
VAQAAGQRPVHDRGSGRETSLGLALAGATVAAFLGGAEWLARFAEPQASAPAAYITDWQAWDGEFYTVKSTAVGWPPWEDYNAEGLRDREHTPQKRPSAWRVACLGDSVTLGWGIRPEEAWPQVLEQLAAAADRDLDVMNVALGGWSTRQELIAYRKIARRYRPDQVLLGICLNDVAEMQNNLSRPPKLLAALYRRSALVRRLVGAREREIGAVEELFRSPDAPNVRRGYERMFADLRALRDEVHADGARFGILVFPFRFQLAADAPPPRAQATIAEFCRREGIAFLDLLPALAAAGEEAFHDYDHFGAEGARLVAEQALVSSLIPPEAGAGGRLAAPEMSTRFVAAGAGAASAWPLPELAAALEDRNVAVRTAALWALGQVGPAAAPERPELMRLLQDGDPFVRAGAAYALGGIGSAAAAAVPALIARLADPDERVRWRAVDALGKIGPRVDSVELLAVLVREAACPGRGLAAEQLGRVGSAARQAVPDLIEAVSDARPDVRWRAVWALGQIGPDAASAVPVLRTALGDADLRWRVAEALGEIGLPAAAAVPDLVPLLEDPSSNVRWRVATALGAIGARRAAPSLAAAASDTAENVRLAAVSSLVELRAEPSLVEPVLRVALHDADARVRRQAVRGVARLDRISPAAWSGLEAATLDADESVREKAIQVLARRRPHRD